MSPDPIFIVGFQRSGTTMLRLMLNAHPDIAIPHDSAELWRDYARKGAQFDDLRSPGDAVAMIDALLREPRIAAWQTDLPRERLIAEPLPRTFPDIMRRFHEVFAQLHGKHHWGDKNTGTLGELDRLNAMFPTCRIIHLVRDGRDCALSHTSKEYIHGYANTLQVAIEWRRQVQLCHKMGAMRPPGRFLEIRYEDLLAEPERQLRRICDFIGVPYAGAMLQYHRAVDENVPAEKRGLWPLLDKPPLPANAYKWKTSMSRADRAVFERNAGDLLAELGYETLPPPVHEGRWRELWLQLHERLAWRLKRLSR
jgi:hypothetical protein